MWLKIVFKILLLPIVLGSMLSTSAEAAVPLIDRGMVPGNGDQETAGEVSVWQEYLIQGGYLKINQPTGIFGGLTGLATELWQKDHDITPTSPSVGPRVRAKLKELAETAVKSPTPIQPTSQVSSVIGSPTLTDGQIVPLTPCFERRVPEIYATIGEAIRAACANDLVLIGPGTYEESIINITQPVVILGVQGRDKTIIRATRGPALLISAPISGVVIDGLTLIGATNQPAALVNVSPRLLTPTIALTIKNSSLKNSEIGLSVSAPAGEVDVERTIIAENRTDGVSDNFGGIITLVNNTIAQNDTGYSLQNLGGHHVLTNNIIVQNKTDGVAVSYLGKETTLDMNYNNVANNDKNNYYTYRDAAVFVPRGLVNLSYNPGFVSQNDYRLISTSKLIDAGDPKTPLDEDGTRADIGALAFDQRQLKSGASLLVSVGKLLSPIISWMW